MQAFIECAGILASIRLKRQKRPKSRLLRTGFQFYILTMPTAPLIKYSKKGFDRDTLLYLHEQLLRPRLIEEKMLILLRQNKISKWFSGIGQEAIAVGITQALEEDE